MPRKKSSIPPSTRIRDNQRRSRARKNELIEDLQHRLRAYEEKESQATIDMQLAARQVVWENTQLRELLASKCVSREEIDGFLRSRERISVRGPSSTPTGTEIKGMSAAQLHDDRPIEDPTSQLLRETWGPDMCATEQGDSKSIEEIEANICTKPPARNRNEMVPRLGSPTQPPTPGQDNWSGDVSDQSSAVDVGQSNILPAVSECFCPDPLTSRLSTADDLMLEMSCETAASIISSMRGDGHQAAARAQLGCEGWEHCTVKNMKVMQLMEMS